MADNAVDGRLLKHRSPVLLLLLGYVTLLAYPLFWCWRASQETAAALGRGKQSRWPPVLAGLAYLGFWTLAIVLGLRAGAAGAAADDGFIAWGMGIGLALTFAVAYSQAGTLAKAVCTAAGVEPPSKSLHTVLVLLVGVVWLPVAVALTQNALNRVRMTQAEAAWRTTTQPAAQ